ncbi:MAG: T9SS type A sorting domain-containing protein [Bacteroidales bacterium]
MKKLTLFLMTFLLSSMAIAQWSSDPMVNKLLSEENKNIYSFETANFTNGDTYICYHVPVTGAICTHLQILSKTGVKKLPENGLVISNHKNRSWTVVNQMFIVDKEGNAIVVVQDCRNATDSNDAVNYTAYKISPSGEFLWGKEGVDLDRGKGYNLEAVMNIIEVGDQYMFAWTRIGEKNTAASAFGLYANGIYGSSVKAAEEEIPGYIVMERLDKAGKFVGTTQYLKDPTIPYNYPWIKNAGNGQAILVYAKGTNQDLMARKIDFDGSSVWPQDVTIYRGGFGSIPIWTFVEVYEDPRGGVFVSWHDDRNFTNVESAFLSYIKPDGTYGYSAGIEGQQIGFSGFRQFHPKMVYNPSDESSYVVWRETSAAQSWQRLCAQRITKEGELMWDPNGVDVQDYSKGAVGYYNCQLDDKNRMINFFMIQDSVQVYGETKALACLLEANGKFAWGKDKKFAAISTAKSEKGNLTSTSLGDKQWVLAWEDARSAPNSGSTLYGQNMNLDGSLGNIVDNEILQDAKSGFSVYPNPMQKEVYFLIQVKGNSKVNLSIYNSLGQKINSVFDGNLSSGAHEFSWNGSQVKAGIYFAVLNNNGKISSFKMVHQ